MNKILAVLGASLISASASASLMTLETRGITGSIDDTDFITSWNNQTSAINTSTLSDFNMYQSGNNSISHLSVDFSLASSGNLIFQAGLDAGYGAAFYLDNSLIENRTDDLWWGYNWNHSDVMTSLSNSLSSGDHMLDLYWAEGCCNGASSLRYSTDNGSSWQSMANANDPSAQAVSEPGSLLLLSLGLIGVGTTRRLMKK